MARAGTELSRTQAVRWRPPQTGLARGVGHVASARLGALAAAEVIGHLGARPATSLKALAAQHGLAP